MGTVQMHLTGLMEFVPIPVLPDVGVWFHLSRDPCADFFKGPVNISGYPCDGNPWFYPH